MAEYGKDYEAMEAEADRLLAENETLQCLVRRLEGRLRIADLIVIEANTRVGPAPRDESGRRLYDLITDYLCRS